MSVRNQAVDEMVFEKVSNLNISIKEAEETIIRLKERLASEQYRLNKLYEERANLVAFLPSEDE